MRLIRVAGTALAAVTIVARLLRLASTWRLAGVLVVALTWALITEVLLEVAIVLNQGRLGDFLGIALLILLPPLVGAGMAYRYWAVSEYDPRRVFRQPLFALLCLLLVLVVSGFFKASR